MSFFSRWSRREIAAIALAALFAVAFMFAKPAVMGPREASSCQNNLKQMSNAMLQYNRDYDEKYPLAKNWTDALQPYWKPKAEQYQCPARQDLPFGYAMHASVAGLSLGWLYDPQNTVLFFDSDAGTPNHTDAGSSLPTSPRHPKGHSIAFTDGHTEFVEKPDMKRGYDPTKIAQLRVKQEKEIRKFEAEMLRRNQQRMRKQQEEKKKLQEFWRKWEAARRREELDAARKSAALQKPWNLPVR